MCARGEQALAWLKDEGLPGAFVHPSLSAAAQPGAGEGFVVTAAVPSGTLLLQVPRSVHLTSDIAERVVPHVLGSSTFEHSSAAGALAALLCLLIAQPSGSPALAFWKPYLATLPVEADFETLPQLWTNEQLALLGDAALQAAVQEDRAAWREEYSELRAAWPASLHTPDPLAPGAAESDTTACHSTLLQLACPEQAPTWEQYQHCRACVATRVFLDGLDMDPAFVVPGVEHMLGLALVPVSDMLNHETAGPCTAAVDWVSRPSAVYEVRTTTALEAGQAVSISYGTRGSSDLLQTYGFVLPVSHADEALLLPRPRGDVAQGLRAKPDRMDVPLQWNALEGLDEHWERRQEWWDFMGLPGTLEVPPSADGLLEYLAAARVAALIPDEVRAAATQSALQQPVSLASELAACKTAIWQCQVAAADLATADAASAALAGPAGAVSSMAAAYRADRLAALQGLLPWLQAFSTVALALLSIAPAPREHLVATKSQLLQPLDALTRRALQGFKQPDQVKRLVGYAQALLRLALASPAAAPPAPAATTSS